MAYFYSLIPNYGVAIIMLTILVRTAMIPLAIKQAHSMQANRGNAEKMRKLQPEVKKLREKYKDDRQRQYEEQKKLYEEHGVNMLGGLNGCLPMLLQMPIFFAMYAVLQGCSSFFGGRNCVPGFHIPKDSPLYTAIVERTATFLGTNLELRPSEVLSQAGPVSTLPYLVLIGVMGGSMWYQTQMMMKAQPAPDPQFAATQKVMKFMPLMLVVFSWGFPAGLILYWSATNVWTIGQQFVLMKRYGGPAPGEKSEDSAKAGAKVGDPPAGKGGGTGKAGTAQGRTSGKHPGSGAKSGSAGAKGRGGQKRPAGAGKAAVQPGGQRRPAAKQARPAAKGSRADEPSPNGDKGKRAADPSAKNGAAKAASGKPAGGRPKGSGARKGNRGGRR